MSCTIEIVVPLKASNEGRGSDLSRFELGFLRSFERWVDASFVDRVTVVAPDADTDVLAEALRARFEKIVLLSETTLLGSRTFTGTPRRGWYVQQLIKLAYAAKCKTRFYLTLDADVLAISPVNSRLFVENRAPLHLESLSAHAPWWARSAAILRYPPISEVGHSRGIGVTPALLEAGVVQHLVARLNQIGIERGFSDWIDYLVSHATNDDHTWTEYTLYWTYFCLNNRMSNSYHEAELYSFFHDVDLPLLRAAQERCVPFAVIQSSFVSHEALVGAANFIIDRNSLVES